MNKPINNHPMQLREDLWAQESVPVWVPYTGELLYIGHSPLLNVEYMYSTDGEALNEEGATLLLKIHHAEATHMSGEWHNGKELSYKRILKDVIVFAISIDWEDKEHKTCVPEVPAPRDWEREILHAKAHPKPKNIVRVWDVLFYLEDENGQMARDYKGRVQIFDAPDMDVSDIGYGVDVKDLRKHSVDE